LKEGLELLSSLQQKDDQIRETESLIREIPESIKDLERERDGKKEMIEQVKQKRDENVKKREDLEKEILLIKEKIKKYQEQMNKSTTNKEYQGFITEIKYEEDKIASVEEKIIHRMLEFDDIMEEIRKREGDFNQIADEYNKKIQNLRENLDYNKSKLQEELEIKSDIRAKIPEKLVRMYDNLFVKKAGKVVSVVETEFCGVCNVKIRPQLLNELISTDNLFICENCGRILFIKIKDEEQQAAK
jgi:predicted  nucleic acid-binding Zn-ribbon protein